MGDRRIDSYRIRKQNKRSLIMEVRPSRTTAVVVQHVPTGKADWFLEWQQGVAGAAEEFAGFRGIEAYPPADDQHDEWVVVIHFVDESSLQGWLKSSVRAQWVEKLQEVGGFELKALPGGFGPWFAGLRLGSKEAPPSA
jgi:antibiotic biosynthesis monooxygenase (ABM) superfamily enzyme